MWRRHWCLYIDLILRICGRPGELNQSMACDGRHGGQPRSRQYDYVAVLYPVSRGKASAYQRMASLLLRVAPLAQVQEDAVQRQPAVPQSVHVPDAQVSGDDQGLWPRNGQTMPAARWRRSMSRRRSGQSGQITPDSQKGPCMGAHMSTNSLCVLFGDKAILQLWIVV